MYFGLREYLKSYITFSLITLNSVMISDFPFPTNATVSTNSFVQSDPIPIQDTKVVWEYFSTI